MSWLLVKLWLSKAWLWIKKNWQIASIVVLSLLVVLLLKRDKKMVTESLKIAQESYKNQIDALNESYEKEEQRRAEADENYRNTVEKIEKDYLKHFKIVQFGTHKINIENYASILCGIRYELSKTHKRIEPYVTFGNEQWVRMY